MADKYVQLHPTNAEDNIINEEVNLYPIIGPESFKNFETEGETFEPQKKLVPGTNLKNITIGTQTFSLLGADSINLNAILLDLLYPVGSVYTSVNDPYEGECPIQHTLGIGTWERITDTFLYAKGEEDELGATGGSKNAIVVSHTHSVTGGTHTHPVNISEATIKHTQIAGWNVNSGSQISESDLNNFIKGLPTDNSAELTNISNPGGSIGALNWVNKSSNNVPIIKVTSKNTHTATIQSGSGSHTHSVSTEGVSGEGKNMPPYLVVMAWKRVA